MDRIERVDELLVLSVLLLLENRLEESRLVAISMSVDKEEVEDVEEVDDEVDDEDVVDDAIVAVLVLVCIST